MKTHLPSHLFRALISTWAVAMPINTTALADMPKGYNPVSVSSAYELSCAMLRDYPALLVGANITNNSYGMFAAHQYWTDKTPLTHNLTFSGISLSGGADGGGAFCAAVLTMEELKQLLFKNCRSTTTSGALNTYGGGAILGNSKSGKIDISQNGTVEFSGNYAFFSGGAIYAIGDIVLSDNGVLSFHDNYSSDKGGGAIYSKKSLTILGNGSVTFSENTSSSYGGAIYGESSSAISLTNNGSVTFSGNSSTSSSGGAICGESSSTISLTDSKSVTFSENTSSSRGGAIYSSLHGSVTLSNIDTLCFSKNKAGVDPNASGTGGAIYSYGPLNITNNGSVTFSENTSSSYGGAIYSDELLNLTGNEIVAFSGNSAGIGGAICGHGTLNLTNNKSLEFSNNNARSGGAIENFGTLNLTGNRNLMFCGNTASGGGAINVGDNKIFNLTNNESVVFTGNSSSGRGGAINAAGQYSTCTINLTSNKSLEFSGNSSSSMGGAISLEGTLNLTGNGSVTFSSNSSSKGEGGAISAAGVFNLMDNESMTFNGNASFGNGGAIYSGYLLYDGSYGTLNIKNNGIVTFSENTSSSYGGAIYSDGMFNLSSNGSVEFSKNSSSSYGGAIHSSGVLELMNNDSVVFMGNSSFRSSSSLPFSMEGTGGAIYQSGGNGILMTGNGSVTFSGNYEQVGSGSSSTFRLRSVYTRGNALTLAAGWEQHITFYDALFASDYHNKLMVSFNADYQDKDGVTQDATGDIVFSGKYAKQNLAALKTNYTQQELKDSLTTEVYATTNLYGGRLRIEDGAIYMGRGINVAEDSDATLRLDGGTLAQSGYDVLLNAGTTLDLAGENTITASTLDIKDGSTLVFNLGSQEGALLNLDAVLKTGNITIFFDGDLREAHDLINLADASQYDTELWSEQNITLRGMDFLHLAWEDGVLKYKGAPESHIVLNNDKEIEDFDGGGLVDIEGNGHKLTVKNMVQLVKLAMKNGPVKLEGENNSVVHITLTENGTLELAAGAGLSVGNIVSMVANQSANIVITGDIEITDAEMYGTHGRGTLSYASMTIADDYTIKDVDINGSYIKLEEGTTLYLKDVNISANSRITDDSARLFIEGGKAFLDESNTEASAPTMSLADVTFYRSGDTETWVTLHENVSLVSLTSEVFTKVMLTGTDLWLELTGLSAQVGDATAFSVSFEDGAHFDVDSLRVYATLNGEKYLDGYTTQQSGGATTLYFSKQIPEPTTSTLSLLALAALASRRKKEIANK